MEFTMITIFLSALALSIILVVSSSRMTYKSKNNECLPDAVETCIELVNSSKRSVNIVTDLSPEVFENPQMLSIMSDAIGNGVHFNILHESGIGLEKLPKFKKMVAKAENRIVVRELSIKPPYHFWVADGNNVRIEKPHPKGVVKNVQAYLRFNTLVLGVKYDRIFSALWKRK
jgi:hypothetical protein